MSKKKTKKKRTKKSTNQKGIKIDLVSGDRFSTMASMEKIRFILDMVRNGSIVILERGLTPEEEAKLIEMTMTEITPDDFSGIEIESYPCKQRTTFLGKLLGKTTIETRLTVVGAADQLKTLKRDHDFISALVSVRS
ncbi:MAG: DUF2073 domain-containing protein [Methanosarcinales archaeon]|nr:MAG: DUF2073 domain-containing protein [Methanosarcinales archaeon]